jgi:sterol desaturase/sphingolipid hydroxylase (fatty acid hydroxylase superfamily)
MPDTWPIDVVATLATGYLGHAVACVTQCTLHRWLGHSPAGGFFFRTHAGSHHTIYTETRMVSPDYSDREVRLTPFFILPALLLCGLFIWLLPVHLAAGAGLGLVVSFALQVYLHAQYHVESSRLRRYGWFLRLERLHGCHHREGDANYGLVDFLWDRIGGTYCDPEPRA